MGGSADSARIHAQSCLSIVIQRSVCAMLMYSSALWPWAMLPGPQTRVATPISSNSPPSVPNATVEKRSLPHHCASQRAKSDCGSLSSGG